MLAIASFIRSRPGLANLRVDTSRASLKEAFRLGWLDDEQVWLDMLDSRNTTSHEYLAEELATNNYDDIKKVTPIFRSYPDQIL
jgi:nucleotidyltransferase substrate binding protein (TIGR01987 family)